MSVINAALAVKGNKEKYKIGIPRGLFFYKYFPLWKSFLEFLGNEVVVSPSTTTKIVEEGSKAALGELCVPMKVFYGHVLALLREYPDIDYIFIPRYVSTHKERYFCPKFMVLPEQIRYAMNVKKPILVLDVDAKSMTGVEGALLMGEQLGFSREKTGQAWFFAHEKWKAAKEQAKEGDWLQQLNELDPDPKHKKNRVQIKQNTAEAVRGKYPVNILLLGHAYNVYEVYINQELEARLKALDANVQTMERLPDTVFDRPVIVNKQYYNYWEGEEELMQTARYFLREGKDQTDGVIFLISFACGPDSMIQELVMRDMKKRRIPFLELTLDEHSGEGGLVTRIEAFVDMVRRSKYGEKAQ